MTPVSGGLALSELPLEEPADRARRVGGLIRVLASKDPDLLVRSGRVARVAVGMAAALEWDPADAFLLQEAALLQDIGTLYGIGDDAPGTRPTEPDRAHPMIGAMMAADVLVPEQVSWIRCHHERWDGNGYPAGLRGSQIPIGAALIGLADTWYDLRAPGVQDRRSRWAALSECRSLAGEAFAEVAVEGLVDLLTRREPAAAGGAPAPD